MRFFIPMTGRIQWTQQTTTEVSDTSDVFLAGGLSADTWTCDVTPYDGTDYGSSMGDSVTVESGCSSLDLSASFNNSDTDAVVVSHNSLLELGNRFTLFPMYIKIQTTTMLSLQTIFLGRLVTVTECTLIKVSSCLLVKGVQITATTAIVS